MYRVIFLVLFLPHVERNKWLCLEFWKQNVVLKCISIVLYQFERSQTKTFVPEIRLFLFPIVFKKQQLFISLDQCYWPLHIRPVCRVCIFFNLNFYISRCFAILHKELYGGCDWINTRHHDSNATLRGSLTSQDLCDMLLNPVSTSALASVQQSSNLSGLPLT